MTNPERTLRTDDPIARENYVPDELDGILTRVISTSKEYRSAHWRRYSSRIAVPLALTLAIGGAFLSGAELASASGQGQHVQPACGTSVDMPNWPTVQAANQLNSSLESSYPSVFAGIVVSDCNAVITIYETEVSPQIGASAAAIAPPGSLRFEVVPNSLAQLLGIQRLLEQRSKALQSEGINIQGFGTDSALNREVIDVTNATNAAIERLQAEFGAGLIQVNSVPPNYTVPLSGSFHE